MRAIYKKSMTVTYMAGASVDAAALETAALALEFQMTVTGDFNGRELRADPKEIIDLVSKDWIAWQRGRE